AGPTPSSIAGDHDGRTISKAQLAAMRAGANLDTAAAAPSPATPSLGGPSVQAVLCPNRHGNPTHLAVCRECGLALSGPPVLIARPPLGVLVLSTGERVTLDRPAILGRNPKLEGRVPSELPQVIKLEAGANLSRSHAMVRLEGWQVLIEDLNSQNGTVVVTPGQSPRRLRAGEPALLEPGTVVDLGGEVTLTYQVR
ncbi:MAG TPA: FHA domain-containing protein, partial [Ilumatobacteraceae bacterium]|nr:FHA domain-containing protein [Ilumatobacteraceae bacterium]